MDGATSTRFEQARRITSSQNNTVLVLGLGNTLLADDGVGIHIVRSLGCDPAGTLRLLDREELARHVARSGRISAHEAGLADLLTLARLEGFAPRHLALLGIQPQTVDWGEALSPRVADAAAIACRLAVQTAMSWMTAP